MIPILTPDEASKRLDELLAMPIEEETLEKMAQHINEIRAIHHREDVRINVFTVPEATYKELDNAEQDERRSI